MSQAALGGVVVRWHVRFGHEDSVRPLRDAESQVLNSLTARRHQVLTMLVSEKNRLGTAISAVRPRIEAHIAWLEQELSDLDKELRQSLRRSPVWREKDDLLRTVPGVGEQLSLSHPAGRPARVGHSGPTADRGLGGRGALQPRQRYLARPTRRLGRTLPGSGCSLHGDADRDPFQSRHQRLLPEAAGGRQAEESGLGCLHA